MASQAREPTLSLQDVWVNVRRQNTTQEERVLLTEEFDRFFTSHFPGWEERMITLPEGFEFDPKRLHHSEGLIDVAKTMQSQSHSDRQLKIWLREAHGQQGMLVVC